MKSLLKNLDFLLLTACFVFFAKPHSLIIRFSNGEIHAKAMAATPDRTTNIMKKSWSEAISMMPKRLLLLPSG